MTDIVEVIGKVVKLDKRGKRYVGLCPFHKEKTPSFSVAPDKGLYYCFGCHSGGDAESFIMRQQGVDYAKAREIVSMYDCGKEKKSKGGNNFSQETLIEQAKFETKDDRYESYRIALNAIRELLDGEEYHSAQAAVAVIDTVGKMAWEQIHNQVNIIMRDVDEYQETVEDETPR